MNNRTKIKQLVFQELLEIIELFPNINIATHLYTILRPHKESFNWTDEQLVKRIEMYRSDLEELEQEKVEEDEDDY